MPRALATSSGDVACRRCSTHGPIVMIVFAIMYSSYRKIDDFSQKALGCAAAQEAAGSAALRGASDRTAAQAAGAAPGAGLRPPASCRSGPPTYTLHRPPAASLLARGSGCRPSAVRSSRRKVRWAVVAWATPSWGLAGQPSRKIPPGSRSVAGPAARTCTQPGSSSALFTKLARRRGGGGRPRCPGAWRGGRWPGP